MFDDIMDEFNDLMDLTNSGEEQSQEDEETELQHKEFKKEQKRLKEKEQAHLKAVEQREKRNQLKLERYQDLMPYEQIALMLGISTSEVRRIEKQALRKLKADKKAYQLYKELSY